MSDELLKQLGLYVYILLFTKKKKEYKKGKGRSGENSASHIGGRWSARDEKAAHKRIYYS